MANEIDLEIPLSQFLNVASFKKMVDISAEKGFLVKDGAVLEWTFSGVRYRDGAPILYGPQARGVPLAAALEQPRREALAAAAEVVRALALIEDAEDRIEIFPESVWLLSDGSVLFLPAEVFRKMRLLSDDGYKTRCSRLNDPYAVQPRERLSHVVGVMLYRALTGAYPYDGRDLDEIHARIRERKVIPPQLLFPDLKKSVSDLFGRFFEKKQPLSAVDWKHALEIWLADGYTEARSADETTAITDQRDKLKGRLQRGLRRRLYLEKHGKTLLIAAAAVAAVGVAAGFIVSNALRPRLTAGFPPLKVVESFYQSIDTLNPELMRDCLQGDTAAGELQRNELMFINTRQMEYYTRKRYRLQAGEWLTLGRPRISPPSYIEGVAALVVREISGGTEPVFEAQYERWLHIPAEEGGAGFYQEGHRVKDRLTLAKDDRGWLITKLDRLEDNTFYKGENGYQPSEAPLPSATAPPTSK
ncbi:MAG: hypothetical protein JXD23_09785 [Spirochaetales bacterium]|nr:hypothetical protein [Spirochaetales bacterium]